MLIFQNASFSYPIRGVPDNISGVCYRSSRKGWMDYQKWKEWLTEPRALKKLPQGRIRTLFVDNCPSHVLDDETRECLKNTNTELRRFPANSTKFVLV